MGRIGIGSGRTDVTITTVKCTDCTVAGETRYKGIRSGEVCSVAIGTVRIRQGVIIPVLPWSNGIFMVAKAAISVLISLSVQVLCVTRLAVVRIRSIFFAVGSTPAAVMAICTRCN